MRVAYVIDHKLRRHDHWVRRPMETTTVEQVDPSQQAAEIAENAQLHRAPILEQGHEIRVRVWHYSTDEELFGLDSERDEHLGQWTYGGRPLD